MFGILMFVLIVISSIIAIYLEANDTGFSLMEEFQEANTFVKIMLLVFYWPAWIYIICCAIFE